MIIKFVVGVYIYIYPLTGFTVKRGMTIPNIMNLDPGTHFQLDDSTSIHEKVGVLPKNHPLKHGGLGGFPIFSQKIPTQLTNYA